MKTKQTQPRRLQILPLLLSITFLLTAHSFAQWDANYTGDQVASSPWSLSAANYSTGPGTITIGNGTASAWAQQFQSTPGALWNPSTTAASVEINFDIDTPSASLFSTGLEVANGSLQWSILVSTSAISLGGGNTQLVTVNPNQNHVLLATYTASGMDVSLDGTPLPHLQDIAGSATSTDLIYLQRFTGSVGADAITTFSQVAWNNSIVVPEPTSAALLAASLAALTIALRRERKGYRS